jgi:hypothetical protein
MKNWKMWLIAIVTNILFYYVYWWLNPIHHNRNILDLRWLSLLFYLIIFNFIIGIFMATHTSLKRKKIEGQPFLIISILLLLIGWGICYL